MEGYNYDTDEGYNYNQANASQNNSSQAVPATFSEYLASRQNFTELDIPNRFRVTDGDGEENEDGAYSPSEPPANAIKRPNTEHSTEPKQPPKVKRKRPSAAKKEEKQWADTEVLALVEKWENEQVLYNSKHHLYFNKDARSKALIRTQKALLDDEVEATPTQISEKMSNLKTYYGAECRKVEASKCSGSSADSLYKSNWKFYDPLSFLKDNFTPRPTKSNMPRKDATDGCYEYNNPPGGRKTTKKNDGMTENAERVMESAAQALERINARKENAPSDPVVVRNEDYHFSEMVRTMLEKNPESQEKALLRLKIQQDIIKVQYGGERNSFSSPTFGSPPSAWSPYN